MVQTASGLVCFAEEEQPEALLRLLGVSWNERETLTLRLKKPQLSKEKGKARQEEVRPDQGHATFLVAVVKTMPGCSITTSKSL